MPLIHWKPFEKLEELWNNEYGWDLAADVYEQNDSIFIEMHLPEIDPDHVNILVEDNHVYISGSRKHKEDIKDRHYHRNEIMYGSFERIIPLPCSVDEKNAHADISEGVLKIEIPKARNTKSSTSVPIKKR